MSPSQGEGCGFESRLSLFNIVTMIEYRSISKRLTAYTNAIKALGWEGFFESKFATEPFSVRAFNTEVLIRPGTDDQFILEEILFKDRYRLPKGFLDRIRSQGYANIVEVGAHTGISTLCWLNQMPQNVELNATIVEPHPANIPILRRNLAGVKGLNIIDRAIANNSSSKIIIQTPVDERGIKLFGWSNESFGLNGKSYEVATITLDYIFKLYNGAPIDLLIFDAEGAETHVNWEYCLPRTHTIFIETHEHLLRGSGKRFEEALKKSGHILIKAFDENNFLYMAPIFYNIPVT